MDPNFSVLLGNDLQDSCENNDTFSKGRNNGALIGGIIGGIVGLLIMLAFIIFFVYPKLQLRRKTRKAKKFGSIGSFSGEESEMVEIERRANMEVNTSAGNFVVRY